MSVEPTTHRQPSEEGPQPDDEFLNYVGVTAPVGLVVGSAQRQINFDRWVEGVSGDDLVLDPGLVEQPTRLARRPRLVAEHVFTQKRSMFAGALRQRLDPTTFARPFAAKLGHVWLVQAVAGARRMEDLGRHPSIDIAETLGSAVGVSAMSDQE